LQSLLIFLIFDEIEIEHMLDVHFKYLSIVRDKACIQNKFGVYQ